MKIVDLFVPLLDPPQISFFLNILLRSKNSSVSENLHARAGPVQKLSLP